MSSLWLRKGLELQRERHKLLTRGAMGKKPCAEQGKTSEVIGKREFLFCNNVECYALKSSSEGRGGAHDSNARSGLPAIPRSPRSSDACDHHLFFTFLVSHSSVLAAIIDKPFFVHSEDYERRLLRFRSSSWSQETRSKKVPGQWSIG